MGSLLEQVMMEEQLSAVFQPIIDARASHVVGYEGLIRGPAGSPLEMPCALFEAARMAGRKCELERLCVGTIWRRYRQLGLGGTLFFNLSLDMLLSHDARHGRMYSYMAKLGIPPGRVVIEITEDERPHDYLRLRRLARLYRSYGYALAIDDLGAGFAGLRLWLELQPEYVKVDRAMVRGIDADPVKLAFLRGIQYIAARCDTRVVAEGIETAEELRAIRTVGLALAQGYVIARPSATPPAALSIAVHGTGGKSAAAPWRPARLRCL